MTYLDVTWEITLVGLGSLLAGIGSFLAGYAALKRAGAEPQPKKTPEAQIVVADTSEETDWVEAPKG
jgi:hypothetical protein